jgi:hypothetical protein
MFRRITALVCALALAGALAWPAVAAPVTGSFNLDITFYPETGGLNKIDQIVVKFEADLILSLSISGLDLTSTTLFTFKGVEVQLFTAKATVGAMTFSTVLAFAPNIVEIERGICVRRSAPVDHGDATADLGGHHWASCDARTEQGLTAGIVDPFVSTATAPIGWPTLLGVSFYRWPLFNIILGRWADGLNPRAQADACFPAPCINYPVTSMLLPSLTFRKKVAEVTLSIAGLTLGLRSLFANFGGASPSFETGLVLILSGTTVSGITVRSETWVGARPGVECFGECKPLARLNTGTVIPGFEVQEEVLILSGISLAGVRSTVTMQFRFGGISGVVGVIPGVTNADGFAFQPSFMRIVSSARIAPLGITVSNQADFVGLHWVYNRLSFGIRIGEASATLLLDAEPDFIGSVNLTIPGIVLQFDPPGASVTAVAFFCATDWYYIAGLGTCRIATLGFVPFQVQYLIDFEVGNLTVNLALLTRQGPFKGLDFVSAVLTWKVAESVQIQSVTNFMRQRRGTSGDGITGPPVAVSDAFGDPTLAAQQFSIEVKF